MKAEHRKQLQTNVLADRMGRLLSGLKQRPQRRTLLYVVLALAVVLAVFLFFRWRERVSQDKAKAWMKFENGHPELIEELAGLHTDQKVIRFIPSSDDEARQLGLPPWKYGKQSVGKAARFQLAWTFLWEDGIKHLAASPGGVEALKNLQFVRNIFGRLAEDCKDDPYWEPEAHYALAVIDETFAVVSPEYLPKARDKYAEIAEKFKGSPQAKLAEERAKLLATRATYDQVEAFYAKLKKDLKIPDDIKKQLEGKGGAP